DRYALGAKRLSRSGTLRACGEGGDDLAGRLGSTSSNQWSSSPCYKPESCPYSTLMRAVCQIAISTTGAIQTTIDCTVQRATGYHATKPAACPRGTGPKSSASRRKTLRKAAAYLSGKIRARI